MTALWRAAARLLAASHLAVSAFIVFGGLLVAAGVVPWWAHLPFAAWGVVVHLAHLPCPLTEWEKRCLRRSGAAPYEGGFVEHYLVSDSLLTRVRPRLQALVGGGVLVTNLVGYGVWLAR